MPDIYRYFGFVFFFHSNEHDPIHVHVQHDHKESVFDIIMEDGKVREVLMREKKGISPLSSTDQRVAERFVREYADNIIDKWTNYFVKKKRVVCTTIKKETEMKYLRIERADYVGRLTVKLTFNDGAVVTINFGSWIAATPHPQYNRYLDEKKFKKYYIDDMGNIAWGKNRDLYFPIDDLHKGNLAA